MKTYNIYKHPLGDLKAIKVGWSWTAFFFTWIWAFVKGLYVVGAILLIIDIAEFLIGSFLFPFHLFRIISLFLNLQSSELRPFSEFIFLLFFIDIIIRILAGSMGNSWLERNLAKKGYEFIKSIKAETPEGALAILAKTSRLIIEGNISTGEDISTKEESEVETDKSISIQEILLVCGIVVIFILIILLISR